MQTIYEKLLQLIEALINMFPPDDFCGGAMA